MRRTLPLPRSSSRRDRSALHRASGCGRSTAITSGPTTLSRTAPTTDADIGCSMSLTSLPTNAWRSVSPASSKQSMSSTFCPTCSSCAAVPVTSGPDNGPEFVPEAVQAWITQWGPINGNAVYSAAFSRDGSRIVTASKDKTARIWDAANAKEIAVGPRQGRRRPDETRRRLGLGVATFRPLRAVFSHGKTCNYH